MKAYKGFNKDMTCLGFQFEEGKTFEHEGEVEMCSSGFHACEDALDCLQYYAPAESIYHEVELDGVSNERKDDSKVVAKKIKIGGQISLSQIVKASIDFRFSKTTVEPGAHTEKNRCSVSATGDSGAASATGYRGAASATGYRGAASATGDSGAASATGYRGAASATGDYGAASATGKAGVALAAGLKCKAMGKIGCALCLIERKWNGETYEIVNAKAVIVDGKDILPDVWYALVDGEIVKVD